MNLKKRKEMEITFKKVMSALTIAFMVFVTLAGALAQEEVELPEAGFTPLSNNFLWNIEILGEGIKASYLNNIKRDPVEYNKYKIEKIQERLAEYEYVEKFDSALGDKILERMNRASAQPLAIEISEDDLTNNLEVLMRVRARLRDKGVEPKGIDIAIRNAENKIEKIEEYKIQKQVLGIEDEESEFVVDDSDNTQALVDLDLV